MTTQVPFEEEKYLRIKIEHSHVPSVSKMSGARFIAETLSGYGVSHVFYMEAIIRRALVEMEDFGIRRILTHSEKAAAYMADGYARASRKPGICMAQSVGAANLASGLQDPFLGGSPVIAITGRKLPIAQYRNAYQEIQHNLMFNPVTKYNVCVDTVEQLPFLLRQAFREATSGAPGPVHLDLMGYEGESVILPETEFRVIVEKVFAHCPAIRIEPDRDAVRDAAEMIKASKKPVIVAGGGAIVSSAGPEIRTLAEMLSIPVATSLNGKGTIVENHRLSVGVVGAYGRVCANAVVSNADLVIFIGSHTGDMVTYNWTVPPVDRPVIQIDIDPVELGRSYPNIVGILGDAKIAVRRLLEHFSADTRHPGDEGWVQSAQQEVIKWRADFDSLRNSNAVPILPERLCKEITDALPSDALLVSDTGFAALWTGTLIDLTHPDQRYMRAAGSLGWAFPASIGAKCALPDRPVICFTGDGGFWYHLSELETACRWGINIITVVNNNGCMRQCVKGINRAYGDKPGAKDDMFRYSKVNFADIARDIGCLGLRVDRPEDIAQALRTALATPGPVVVDVVTDPEHDAPWIPPAAR